MIEIGGGIAAFVMKGKVTDTLRDTMKDSMKNYNKTDSEGVTKVWDYVQKEVSKVIYTFLILLYFLIDIYHTFV